MEVLLALFCGFCGILGTSVWSVKESVLVESCQYRTIGKATDYLKDIEQGCFNL